VSQHSVACSLEIFSRLLAQIFLLKTRLQFVSACAPGLWEYPEDGSADRHFFISARKQYGRKMNKFFSCRVTVTCSSAVAGASYSCKVQAAFDSLHCLRSVTAVLVWKSQLSIVHLTGCLCRVPRRA